MDLHLYQCLQCSCESVSVVTVGPVKLFDYIKKKKKKDVIFHNLRPFGCPLFQLFSLIGDLM